ncbi:MAG TPA: 2Fe-2S iron-sulfur cluster-binding protein [Gaiellaceae bacterium]|jgi:sarcosine oxidase subunit alpha|nr:2Fe-2S iron-sulfur cluster-binding protein [Gaiellaceae bacterium]
MRFRFDGVEYGAREGDTLAAALVRNGVVGGFRSPYRGRPRGVTTRDESEPSALVQVGARTLVRATLLPVVDGLEAEPLAGKGRLVPAARRPLESVYAHCDVLVVGGGRAGRVAAAAAQGRLVWLDGLRDEPELTHGRTWAVGLYDDNWVVALERERRLWRIRARRVVLATGATERLPVVPDNDRPGVLVASAAAAYEAPEGAVVGLSGGWTPRVALWSQARGRLRWDERIAAPVPDGELPGVECVGSATGAGLPDAPAWRLVAGDEDAMFVDLERDVTVADLRRALRAGLRSLEHVKRYTTAGTGSGQGKLGNANAVLVAAELLGVEPGELGTTTVRPPYVPVPFPAVAGRDRGALFDPVRVTPLDAWHAAHGAVWENVGQWRRPRYYPLPGEDMDAAVARECAAAREGVATMDASPLGKIDVQGPDAVELLNRLYTNAFDSLAVGRCRYAVMCTADGMVFDDGVVMRVGPKRFVCTTTTGNAAAVLAWMEEWLQTEWPELRVWLTSVTEQWATVAVVGPGSRDLLTPLTDVPLGRDAFEFMGLREGVVAGIPARICRVSFSGELAFEVNVDGRRSLGLWEAIHAAGDVTPYGTEAMHVLRAEKGYPIVGQDTDGTVTPHDLGMGWIVSRTKGDFVGRRSFARADTARSDRRQLVGLLPDALLPEGAQVVESPVAARAIGHVTSSYHSVALGRPFALALVSDGRAREGTRVWALAAGGTIEADLVGSVLYDPEGMRRDGVPV